MITHNYTTVVYRGMHTIRNIVYTAVVYRVYNIVHTVVYWGMHTIYNIVYTIYN